MSEEEGYDLNVRELSDVETLRHSAAHLLASAVAKLYPGTRFAIGPHIEHGFFYDMELPDGGTISEDDLPNIEVTMRKIAKGNHRFERTTMNREDALAWAAEHDQEYKRRLIESFDTDEIGFYTHGDFTDMCAGPHVRYSKKIKHFKLTKVSGAYWRGDEKNEMLTRVYGVAFTTKDDLEKHLHFIEEAKKRDHRKVGRELDLFMFHDWAPGAPFWLPAGEFIYDTLASRMRALLAGDGYQVVRTPLVFDKSLFETSGHWDHYRDDMFHFPEKAGEKAAASEEAGHQCRHMGLKPMNCPSHMLIFGSRQRSYRELPLRIHDQGVLHRNERSGALSGLTRVRQFAQDDGHIFCTEEQIETEVAELLGLVDRVYSAFGMTFRLFLSTRPEKKLGDDALWDQAESALKKALDSAGREYEIKEGDGAFYGPKIDFDVMDALERRHQCATIQLDFQLPRRFDLSYVGADNTPHTPVVIHRAVMGSFERFIGILIEHFGGAFPVWLAPEQVRVMTVSEKTNAYGAEVVAKLEAAGIRVEFDDGDQKIGYKIRSCHHRRVPYMAVIGLREAEEGTLSIRARDEDDGVMSIDDFIAKVTAESVIPF